MNERAGSFRRGITLRSVCASIFCMLIAGMYTQYSEVILSEGNAVAEQVLPIPAMSVLLLLLALCAGVYSLFKVRLLTRAELLCVFFSMLISIPLMTQGMWHRFIGLISHPPRGANFSYMDAYSDKLWPQGPNLLQGMLAEDRVTFSGQPPEWKDIEYRDGVTASLPVLRNERDNEISALSMVIEVERDGRSVLLPSNPHLVSVLARTTDMGPDSLVFCRVYEDDAATHDEIFAVRRANERTFLHQTGFVRIGAYGARFSAQCRNTLRVELGLAGRGEVAFGDAKLMSVAALEGVFKGRDIIRRSEYEALAREDRDPGLVIKPDNMWSLSGLWFLIAGYIPLAEWMRPAFTWSSFVLLLAAGCFAMNVIMRRQWVDSERYPLPNTRIPTALIGGEAADHEGVQSLWRNRFTYAGLIVALFWGGMKGWRTYNGAVPDMSIAVDLSPFFQDPSWNGMWNTTFTVSIFIVSIAIFFELNVLISMVVGMWIYRSLFWLGHVTDIKVNAGFPWRYHQAIGAYIGYAVVVLFLTRRYLLGVFRAAIKGTPKQEGEISSYRTAVLVLFGSIGGALLWARWVDVSLLSIFIYFIFLLTLGFVSAKIRAECGLVAGYFTPYNAMLLVSMCGGMAVFGADGMLVTLLLSGFLTVTVFFFIPSAQFELIQLGRRMRINPRDVVYTVLLGILGGLFIGGWVFLSNAYALGGDNIKYQWAFSGQGWFFNSYTTELSATTASWLRQEQGATTGMDWGTATAATWAGLAALIAVLRQLFAGFWFHPVGFILGSSHMMTDFAWGSVFVAWMIRAFVLRFGGATSVRSKLQPFFIGALVGSVLVIVLFSVINSVSVERGASIIHSALP